MTSDPAPPPLAMSKNPYNTLSASTSGSLGVAVGRGVGVGVGVGVGAGAGVGIGVDAAAGVLVGGGVGAAVGMDVAVGALVGGATVGAGSPSHADSSVAAIRHSKPTRARRTLPCEPPDRRNINNSPWLLHAPT